MVLVQYVSLTLCVLRAPSLVYYLACTRYEFSIADILLGIDVISVPLKIEKKR